MAWGDPPERPSGQRVECYSLVENSDQAVSSTDGDAEQSDGETFDGPRQDLAPPAPPAAPAAATASAPPAPPAPPAAATASAPPVPPASPTAPIASAPPTAPAAPTAAAAHQASRSDPPKRKERTFLDTDSDEEDGAGDQAFGSTFKINSNEDLQAALRSRRHSTNEDLQRRLQRSLWGRGPQGPLITGDLSSEHGIWDRTPSSGQNSQAQPAAASRGNGGNIGGAAFGASCSGSTFMATPGGITSTRTAAFMTPEPTLGGVFNQSAFNGGSYASTSKAAARGTPKEPPNKATKRVRFSDGAPSTGPTRQGHWQGGSGHGGTPLGGSPVPVSLSRDLGVNGPAEGELRPHSVVAGAEFHTRIAHTLGLRDQLYYRAAESVRFVHLSPAEGRLHEQAGQLLGFEEEAEPAGCFHLVSTFDLHNTAAGRAHTSRPAAPPCKCCGKACTPAAIISRNPTYGSVIEERKNNTYGKNLPTGKFLGCGATVALCSATCLAQLVAALPAPQRLHAYNADRPPKTAVVRFGVAFPPGDTMGGCVLLREAASVLDNEPERPLLPIEVPNHQQARIKLTPVTPVAAIQAMVDIMFRGQWAGLNGLRLRPAIVRLLCRSSDQARLRDRWVQVVGAAEEADGGE